MKKKVFILLSAIILFLGWKVNSWKPVVVNQVSAQTCTAPVAPAGVSVDYPSCVGTSCDLTQASCSWTAQADATSYNITVTEVETSTVIKNNESVASSTTKVSFPITQKKTYKCDVVAVASCGALSAAASDQLLCDADAIIDTPVPTAAVATPTTATQLPPKAATPTLASPGGVVQTVGILGGVVLAIVAGIMLLVL